MDYNKSTFESVIRKSIKTFKKGKIPEQTFEAMSSDGKEVKYTPEYFDDLEKQVLEQKEKADKKKKTSKNKKEPKDMSEGGTPTESSPGKKMANAAADGMMTYGKGLQEAYDSELDKSKFTFGGTSRR
jgi:Ran GTPase-activating protein (RanGAP) involved in mRNA processing and transport